MLNTSGWFRIGCPSSLTAKPEIPGAVYRIRRVDQPKYRGGDAAGEDRAESEEELVAALNSNAPKTQLAACDEIARRRLKSELSGKRC